MKPLHKIILVLVIVILIALALYLFRHKITDWWVALSALYAGIVSQFKKVKEFFTGTDEKEDELKNRLEESRKIERELLDTLMKEREVYKDKLSQLENQYDVLEGKIGAKKAELAEYSSFEDWRENVYSQMPEDKKQELQESIFGKQGNISDLGYTYER